MLRNIAIIVLLVAVGPAHAQEPTTEDLRRQTTAHPATSLAMVKAAVRELMLTTSNVAEIADLARTLPTVTASARDRLGLSALPYVVLGRSEVSSRQADTSETSPLASLIRQDTVLSRATAVQVRIAQSQGEMSFDSTAITTRAAIPETALKALTGTVQTNGQLGRQP